VSKKTQLDTQHAHICEHHISGYQTFLKTSSNSLCPCSCKSSDIPCKDV